MTKSRTNLSMMKRKYVIYRIPHSKNDNYVGLTSQPLPTRYRQHRRIARGMKTKDKKVVPNNLKPPQERLYRNWSDQRCKMIPIKSITGTYYDAKRAESEVKKRMWDNTVKFYCHHLATYSYKWMPNGGKRTQWPRTTQQQPFGSSCLARNLTETVVPVSTSSRSICHTTERVCKSRRFLRERNIDLLDCHSFCDNYDITYFF